MQDTQRETESIIDIIKAVENKRVMLPEFQRDFRWELEQTYDLFDSMIREIFIGTIIYGKPSFGITLREIDQRPRRGEGSRAKLQTYDFTTEQVKALTQTQNLRIVLDGQQRITSLYRAVTGKGNDAVYVTLRENLEVSNLSEMKLEEMLHEVGGEESKTAISVRLSDAYRVDKEILDDSDRDAIFNATAFGKVCLSTLNETELKNVRKIFRRAITLLIQLFQQQKLVAFYLLDMSLDKFCVFFERSNSRGIQLDFTDILAAKLYHGFNLRKKIEEFQSNYPDIKLTREIIVRAITFIDATEKGKPIKIDKKYILENLNVQTFQDHWDQTCSLYVDSLTYLADQNYILTKDWMPSENMIIPIMIFLRQIKNFSQMSQTQEEFLRYWYWASVFSNRYSMASNEAIIQDGHVLTQIAQNKPIAIRGYFSRLRPLITEPSDLFSYNRKASAIYRGILNLVNYARQGFLDWKNTQKLTLKMDLEDHHIYPRAYVANTKFDGLDQEEAEQLADCVVNRTLIPKLTNKAIGKKAPSVYLKEIEQTNSSLKQCLESHLLPCDMITDQTWDTFFKLFLEERAASIHDLIERHTTDQSANMAKLHTIQSDIEEPVITSEKARLKDLLASGKVIVGDRVFTRKNPTRFAVIKDGDNVEFEGKIMAINAWGQAMTGWSSISIYDSVLLERTGKPLKSLRDTQ